MRLAEAQYRHRESAGRAMMSDRIADGTYSEGAMVDAQLRSASILNEVSGACHQDQTRRTLIANLGFCSEPQFVMLLSRLHRPNASRTIATEVNGVYARLASAWDFSPPFASMNEMMRCSPSLFFRLVMTKGRSPRIRRASVSIFSREAPTCGARSILLMTNRSDRVMPGPPLDGILSPAATSMT